MTKVYQFGSLCSDEGMGHTEEQLHRVVAEEEEPQKTIAGAGGTNAGEKRKSYKERNKKVKKQK